MTVDVAARTYLKVETIMDGGESGIVVLVDNSHATRVQHRRRRRGFRCRNHRRRSSSLFHTRTTATVTLVVIFQLLALVPNVDQRITGEGITGRWTS